MLMLSWGRIRRSLQPLVLKYWLRRRSQIPVKTRVEGFDLEVFPSVFHPRYFGSSTILGRFVSSLQLRGKSFLEVGSGSGVVSLCAARAGARVVAVDVNPEAVRCTGANAQSNGLAVDVRRSDLFAALAADRFDVIAWNPPYLPGSPSNEAESAFYGGADFEVIRRFAAEARNHLNSGGTVYTIVSDDIDVSHIEEVFSRNGFQTSRAQATRWGLGETMIILCAQ